MGCRRVHAHPARPARRAQRRGGGAGRPSAPTWERAHWPAEPPHQGQQQLPLLDRDAAAAVLTQTERLLARDRPGSTTLGYSSEETRAEDAYRRRGLEHGDPGGYANARSYQTFPVNYGISEQREERWVAMQSRNASSETFSASRVVKMLPDTIGAFLCASFPVALLARPPAGRYDMSPSALPRDLNIARGFELFYEPVDLDAAESRDPPNVSVREPAALPKKGQDPKPDMLLWSEGRANSRQQLLSTGSLAKTRAARFATFSHSRFPALPRDLPDGCGRGPQDRGRSSRAHRSRTFHPHLFPCRGDGPRTGRSDCQ